MPQLTLLLCSPLLQAVERLRGPRDNAERKVVFEEVQVRLPLPVVTFYFLSFWWNSWFVSKAIAVAAFGLLSPWVMRNIYRTMLCPSSNAEDNSSFPD